MAKLVVLSAARSPIADAQAHQKDQHKGAHPQCGIGVIVSSVGESGLRLPASATALHQECGGPGCSGRASGISLPPPINLSA